MILYSVRPIILVVIAYLLSSQCIEAQVLTIYNNFGPGHDGWDYNYQTGWTVSGVDVPQQYGVEQAFAFEATVAGTVTDIWVAFFHVPSSDMPDTVTIRLAAFDGEPPTLDDVFEEWIITEFESWDQWSPPIHLAGNGNSVLSEGGFYWLWAEGGETTWCGWCLNVDPAFTGIHTMRREGENWLPIANETASAFRVDIETITAINDDVLIPDRLLLEQNYPNPFNNSTSIKYNLPRDSRVNLVIYDILGRKVTVLVDCFQPAGNYTVNWNAAELVSGVYYYILETDSGSESKKMMLIK